MSARKNHVVKDLLTFVGLVVLIAGIGGVMRGVQEYIAGDWRVIAGCRTSYWQCSSEFAGDGVGTSGDRKFLGGAKSCKQMKAYDQAIRRASLECNFSRSVRRNSCRELRTNCILPNNPQYY